MAGAARGCGSCTLCCKVLGVTAVDKPQHVWCRHCTVGEGCAIHAERPQMCRDFYCMYVMNGSGLGEHWLPARSHMVLCSVPSVPRIEVHVDDSVPDAWRKAPYLGELRAFSRVALQNQGYVMVYEPDRMHVIMPDRIIDLGEPHPDKRIVQVVTRPHPARRSTSS